MIARLPHYLVALGCIAVLVGLAPRTVPAQEMSAEEQAHMQMVMEKYLTPGDMHKHLDAFVGSWTYTSAFWMAPESEPTRDSGTAEYTWLHGGRYLMQSTSGTAMGMPFTGTGITGYDRFRGQYFSFWIDSMGTGYMMDVGHCNESGTVFTYEGTMDDVWTGEEDKWGKTVVTVVSPNAHTMEMYARTPDGVEFKTLEITYARAGSE